MHTARRLEGALTLPGTVKPARPGSATPAIPRRTASYSSTVAVSSEALPSTTQTGFSKSHHKHKRFTTAAVHVYIIAEWELNTAYNACHTPSLSCGSYMYQGLQLQSSPPTLRPVLLIVNNTHWGYTLERVLPTCN